MLQELGIPVLIAIITSGTLGMLGKSLIDWARGKHKEEDNAWKQRDHERRRADLLHEALMKHRTECHKKHGVSFDDMPPFPSG